MMAILGIGLAKKVIMYVENQKMASPSFLQELEEELGN
jgi:hypothetical protein